MFTKGNNIIKYNHQEKSMKVPFVIYADLECILEKMSTCMNNPNESYTTKINKHIPSGYSIFTSCSFDESKNKLNYYRGNDCMKKFCRDLRIHATKIINYEKKKIISLTPEEKINYNDQKVCYICKKEFDTIDKKNYKVRDRCHFAGKCRGAAHNVCNLRYKVPKEIPVVFHNDSTYDYHFIIKELVKEFDGNFDCLGENTEKYITFSVPLKKTIENENLGITYKIKFIDSFRFMSSSLSKLVDNLSERIHNNKCADCKSSLDYIKTKNEKLILECYNCKQRYRKKLNKELIKRFASIYEFCNNDLNKFVLLLRKGVYPYEYMDTWEKFNEISLPSKEDFYDNLNMEDINDIDYRHANNVFKVFKLENYKKNKKVIGLMKDELGGEIITELTALRPKTYSYLTDNDKIDKKAKGTKKCVINKMIKFNEYKKCLLNDEVILKSQQIFTSKKHDVYIENVNKIALSNDDDDKMVLSNDKITTYPYGYAFLNL